VTAAKLAQSGYSVTVCEQNASFGGRCQSITLEGCRFDTGPSLLLLPQVYKDTFKWLGADLSDHVQLARVEPAAYRVWFPDDAGDHKCATLDLLYDVQQMAEQLEELEPGSSKHGSPVGHTIWCMPVQCCPLSKFAVTEPVLTQCGYAGSCNLPRPACMSATLLSTGCNPLLKPYTLPLVCLVLTHRHGLP